MRIAIRIVAFALVAAIAPSALAQSQITCHWGKPSAPVRMDIFSDYQCPACRAFYMETLKLMFKDYADTGKVCVVYRHFPLSIHAHSMDASRYAEAAMRTGLQQWVKVTDALFVNQPQWSVTGDIESVISKVLSPQDMATLRTHLKDPAIDTLIQADINEGTFLKVDSTPTFILTTRGKTEKTAAALRYPALQSRLDALLPK